MTLAIKTLPIKTLRIHMSEHLLNLPSQLNPSFGPNPFERGAYGD